MWKRFVGISVAVLGCTAMSACGGDVAISKSDFVIKANEICKKYNESSNVHYETLAQGGNEPTTAEIQTFFTATFNDLEAQLVELKAIGAPKELESNLTGAYSNISEGAANTREPALQFKSLSDINIAQNDATSTFTQSASRIDSGFLMLRDVGAKECIPSAA